MALLIAPVAKIKIGAVKGRNNRFASNVLFFSETVRLAIKPLSKVSVGLPSKMVNSKVINDALGRSNIKPSSGVKIKIGK